MDISNKVCGVLNMKKKLLSCAAIVGAAAAVLGATPADALTWVSYLEYRDGLVGPQDPPFGTVTLEELDANNVQVTVTLTGASSLFINTGGPHDPFLFNLTDTAGSTGVINAPVDTFGWGGTAGGPFTATPFGDFTNLITCCNGEKGQKAGDAPPLVFTVTNLGGLTFAGVGATQGAGGLLTGEGTGNRFASNDGGWWFAADIYDSGTGLTYNIAARDAFCTGRGCGAVPEPATWGMMVMGFMGAGYAIRRRRYAIA